MKFPVLCVSSNRAVDQRGPREVLPTTQAISKSVDGSPKTDSKALLMKTKPTQLMEHGEVELVSTKDLYHYGLIFMVLEVLCMLQKKKCKHQHSDIYFDLQW